MNTTIGCTTRPFGDAGYTDIFRRIADAGFSDVAIFNNIGIDSQSDPAHTAAVRLAAEAASLKCSMLLAHAELETEAPEERYRRVIDHAAALGASWLLDLGTGELELLDRYVELMRTMAPYAESVGVKISAKPHGGITLTSDDLIALQARVNHRSFGICYDPGNIIYYTAGEERPETNIDRIAPIVTTAIVKDCVIDNEKPEVMINPGDGLVDFHKVFSGLARGGFRGPLYLECVAPGEPSEIDRNVANARAMIEQIVSDVT